MAYDEDLATRIRETLSSHDVREVSMFGGLAFMVNDKIVATANHQGRLMVRCDPDRADDLLQRRGASWPEMRGRRMGRGWIVVDAAGTTGGTSADDYFDFWIGEALAYNRKVARRAR